MAKVEDTTIKTEPLSPEKSSTKRKREPATPSKKTPKKIKTEDMLAKNIPALEAKHEKSDTKKSKPADLQMKKLKTYSATPGQLALAWLLKRSPVMLPIPGTGKVKHLEENAAAAAIDLSDADFATITSLR